MAGQAGTITARGAIARQPGQPAEIEEFTIDAPGPGEARVRVLASGVCHTDLSAKNGVFGTEGFPFLLGHEGAAVVEEVGEGVTNVAPGDHVILAWRAPCGVCRFCRAGKLHLCAASLNAEKRMRTTDGIMLQPILGIGTFCTHTLVHAKQCVPYPAELSPEAMCLIGCGVMTGVGAALYSAQVEPGSSVAVFGCGGVGDSVIMGAKLAGATTIIGVDLDERKLTWAKEFGATHTVNPNDGDPVAAIKELTGGYGVNYSFEAVGRPETTLQATFSGTWLEPASSSAWPGRSSAGATARKILRCRRGHSALVVRRLPADPGLSNAGRLVSAGQARHRPGDFPRHSTRRGRGSVPRDGARRDAALGH